MRKNPRRILSPQRLPFRHPGNGQKRKRLVQSRTFSDQVRCYWGAVGLEFRLHPAHGIERKVRRKMRIPHRHM